MGERVLPAVELDGADVAKNLAHYAGALIFVLHLLTLKLGLVPVDGRNIVSLRRLGCQRNKAEEKKEEM